MSHYTLVRTQIRELPLLLQALDEMGFTHVEQYDKPQHLYGFEGDVRPETAEVIVRREFVGNASNDLGFRRLPSGEYEAVVSEYDRQSQRVRALLAELKRCYAYQVIQDQIREQDLVVESEETLENGDTVIVLSERG